MNYCEKIHYTLCRSSEGDFEQMAGELFTRLPEKGDIVRLVFFGAPDGNREYEEQREMLRKQVRSRFAGKEPVLNYVAQPPLEGGLVMEVHSYSPDKDDKISYKSYEGTAYVLVENADGRFLFSGGWQADLSSDIYTQSKEVFRKMKELLEKESFPIDSIVRQWNYIERITAQDGEDQHYQMFNNARSEFYLAAQWKDGYPAATGIGSSWGGVLVDFDAVVPQSGSCLITPIDNKLQVAAHAYSDDVLLEAGSKKTTPKFERAKSITTDGNRLVYISGTAAIRGEESLTGVGIERQLDITMENIAQLTGNAEICLLRVYLKYPEDYEAVKRKLASREKTVSVCYLETDVCREELLIEIEGIAME